MPELERELQMLGGEIAWPAAPDVSSRVRARVKQDRESRLAWRRPVAIALAILAVAIAAAMAVPQARTAIFRWLGLTGAKIVRVEKLSPVPPQNNLDLGERVTLSKARADVDYHVYVPGKASDPDGIYLRHFPQGGQVSFVYGSPARPRLLFTQFRGSSSAQFIEKQVTPQTRVERVTVKGEPGFWLAGRPHEFYFRGPDGEVIAESIRLAGNVLLWEHDGLLLRLEGRLDKDEALQLAESVR